MVNVPSSDNSHVTSALIAFKQKTLRKISDKIFFIILKNKGADFPKSSSYILGYAQATLTLTSMRKKPTS